MPTFFQQQDENWFLHTVERGQTVYSIAAMYNVAVEDIYALNPQSREVIRVGEQLKIPQSSGSFAYHTIQPKETLYSVSKKYGMKGEDIIAVNPGLSTATFQIGKTIRIPTNKVTSPINGGNEIDNRVKTNNLLSNKAPINKVGMMKIALLLPFGTKENADSQTESVKNMNKRMVEYYEGLLLALKDAKNKGISINLQVYDTGNSTDEIKSIIKKPEMQNVNLIIGGLFDEQIKALARFAKEKDIPYVIPFNSQSNEPYDNPRVFQINTPKSNLYSKASSAFIDKYKRDNIIFVFDSNKKDNQIEFINILQNDLKDNNILYKTIYTGDLLFNDLTRVMSISLRNVIVPTSDSTLILKQLIETLKAARESNVRYRVSLFGSPSWQVYTNFTDQYFNLNTTFYAYFYANQTSDEVKNFYETFQKWYGRTLINSFPKYGILAYDTGNYFISLINSYGSNFYDHINDARYNGLQMNFYFERVNVWGGFINTGLYFVDYTSDFSINKTPISK
ncbi:MAG: LysM peptidoglycan-binding domain-containing protein [Dysgonamonadaceae bacterium]|nr:LysM peptidoglycan-binding domain-containing protein [Dysgonamonadaceae bacterium]